MQVTHGDVRAGPRWLLGSWSQCSCTLFGTSVEPSRLLLCLELAARTADRVDRTWTGCSLDQTEPGRDQCTQTSVL